MYKHRYSILSSVVWLIIFIGFSSFTIFAYVYCSKNGYSQIEIISLTVWMIVFFPFTAVSVIIINNYTAVQITISKAGIEKTKIMGKKEFIEWDKVCKIVFDKVPDYVSGVAPGYKISYRKDKKDKHIYILNKKNKTKIIESFFPNNLF